MILRGFIMAGSHHLQQDSIVSGKTIGSLVLGALVTGLVGGAFGYARIANSDHFTLSTLDRAFTAFSAEVPSTYVRQDLYRSDVERMQKDIADIKKTNEEILRHLLTGGK